MSLESSERSSTSFDKKRRMSLKGPPLRVALKPTAASQPSLPAPVTQRRPSMAPAPVIDRRLSVSAKRATQIAHQKPSAAPVVAPVPVAPAPVDPMIAVNARLDSIERQISELQQAFKQITALEAVVKPLKATLDNMQTQVADLGSSMKSLQQHKQSELKSSEVSVSEQDSMNDELEDVSDVLEELNQSLDNGEIDLETYGSSLRYTLGYDGKSMLKGQMSPIMTSTPIVKRSMSRVPTTSVTCTPNMDGTLSAVLSAQKSFVHEKTPIKKPVGSFLIGMPYQSMSALSTPADTPVERTAVARVSSQLENTTITANKLASASTSSKPSTTTSVNAIKPLPLIELVLQEEKSAVTLWLGLDIAELNRAIPTINQLVSRKRLSICSQGSKEAGFTVEEVAATCEILPKKAKAIVLLLCNLKRLKLVRGEVMAYSVLAGNTLQS